VTAVPLPALLTAATQPSVKLFITTLVRKAGGAPEVRSCGGNPTGMCSLSQTASIHPLCSSILADPAAPVEVVKVSHELKTSTSFKNDLFPTLNLVDNVQVEELVMIATPAYSDWESIILYEGFTTSMGPEKNLFVKFPRAFDWLNDDFTSSVVALIELAEDILDCDRVFVAVERSVAEVNNLVRSLMYVGFSLSPSPLPNGNTDKYLLLEYETE
jgi:hypothetical protein